MTVARLDCVGSGWTGGPGLSSYYFYTDNPPTQTVVDALEAAVNAAYYACRSFLPLGISYQVQQEVRTYDEQNGMQIGDASITAPADPVVGTDNGRQLSRATMMKLRFTTGVFVNGRRIRGGNYFGPLGYTALDTEGQLASAAKSTLTNAFSGLLTVPNAALVVWHRPVDGAGGATGVVTSVTVGTKPATLRSRRD